MTRAKGTVAPATVVDYLERELARDVELRQLVDENLAQMRVIQDLAERRAALGLSQAQLARLMGVSQPLVNRLESGRVTNVGLKTLVRTAAALDAHVKISIVPNIKTEQPAKKVAAGGRR